MAPTSFYWSGNNLEFLTSFSKLLTPLHNGAGTIKLFTVVIVAVTKSAKVFAAAIYEESVVVRIKSNLLLMIFWLHIINYNS